ncbi:MAG: hypothetical protein H6833_11825 [Planctomycetes bacterium]|nr:hypothetical protein [Planctomycetota bacterium]
MFNRLRSIRLLVVAVALPLLDASAQVFVVDAAGGPGSHFTDLPTAVVTVPSGSILKVRAGTYAPFQIANKGLVIVGDDRSSVRIDYTSDIVIGPTQPQHVVRLRHLTLVPPAFGQANHLRIERALGAVLLDDVHVDTPQGSFLTADQISIVDSTNVHLTSCLLDVDPSPLSTGLAGPRITIERSRVTAHDLDVEGHRGPQGSFGWTSAAPPAIALRDAFLALSESRVIGGRGGDGHDVYPYHGGAPGGDGGAAIEVLGASELQAWGTVAMEVRGGMGGSPSLFVYPGGSGGPGLLVEGIAKGLGFSPVGGIPGGQDVLMSGGTWLTDPVTPGPLATLQGVPAQGATVQFDLTGPPGDLAGLAFGLDLVNLPLGGDVLGPVRTLPFFLSSPLQIPATGSLSVPLFVPDLLPPGLVLVAQYVTLHLPTQELRLSNAMISPENL